MLATVRIGAVHVVVFGGFAAKELSVRIDHCKPTLDFNNVFFDSDTTK